MNDEVENRLIEIETALANQEKFIDDLNEVVIKQGKIIDALVQQMKIIKETMPQDFVKPLSEETPPPHY
jgi:SlyX protein